MQLEGPPAVADSQEDEWAAALGQVIADLDCLNRNTERDFLNIGGKLAGFIEAVDLISSALKELANLMSGERGQHASEALAGALGRSRELTALTEEGNGLLGGMRQEAGRLKQALTGFKETVSTFRTLGLLTRIETARLGSAGGDFGNLADDVGTLAANVKARVESALGTAAQLVPPIETAMRNIAALEEGQAKDLPSVISGALAGLESFRDIQGRVHDSSVRLGARYGAISRAFQNLVVSLQFQDITRQQVEHVIEALRRLGGMPHDLPEAADALALQSSQLADAGEKFAASVESVTRSLDDIGSIVLEMAEESRALSGLSADQKNSFFVQMERGCNAILAGLSHCAAAQTAIRAGSGGLAQTIGRTRGPIEEIRAIEIEVQYMAMNARIRAAHLGESGHALSVLAASMQQLASDCRMRSESLTEALGSMTGAVARLTGPEDPAPDNPDGGQDVLLAGLRRAVDELHTAAESSFARIAQVAVSGARLREDLAAARSGFTVGALFAEGVGRARDMLEGIPAAPSARPRGAEASPGLAEFATHYTMQAERKVHEGFAVAAAGAALVEQPDGLPATSATESAEASEAGEVGDNVEFF